MIDALSSYAASVTLMMRISCRRILVDIATDTLVIRLDGDCVWSVLPEVVFRKFLMRWCGRGEFGRMPSCHDG